MQLFSLLVAAIIVTSSAVANAILSKELDGRAVTPPTITFSNISLTLPPPVTKSKIGSGSFFAFSAVVNRNVNIESISVDLGINKTVYAKFTHTFKNGLRLPGKAKTVGPSVGSGLIPNVHYPLGVAAVEKVIGATRHGKLNILSLNASLVLTGVIDDIAYLLNLTNAKQSNVPVVYTIAFPP